MIKLKQILALLLVVFSAVVYAQLPVPTYVGSAKFSAIGSGLTGIPTINFTIPNGTTNKNRMMVITMAGERYNAGALSNFFCNRNSPASNNSNAIDLPDVYVNGVISEFENGYHKNAINSTPTDLQNWSGATWSYKMPDSMTGTLPITFQYLPNPQTANDEISFIISVYGNVKSSQWINGLNYFGYTNETAALTPTLGRTAQEIMYMVNGGITYDTNLSTPSGWSLDQFNKVTNNGVAWSISPNENDGIAHIVAHKSNISGNPTALINVTGTLGYYSGGYVFHGLLPLASPSVSGKVVTPALNSTTGTQGGGLWMNVVDKATNKVVAVVAVDANGNFTIPNGALVETYNYDFILSKNAGFINTTNPITVALNPGWTTVAEGINGTTPDGTANSIFNWTAGGVNVTGVRFAIKTIDPCNALESGNLDSDGDGISDICDLDDDNDGILDTAENSCNLTTSTTWSGTASPVTGTNGSGVTANNITMTSVATTGTNTSFTASPPNGTFNTTNFWSNSAVAGANSLQFVHTWDTTPVDTQQANVDGGTRTYTITFAKPVNKAIIHLDRLGGNYQIEPANYFSNSAEFTLTSSGISMKKLAGNNQLIVTGNKFYRSVGDDLGSVNPGNEANNTYGTAAGSIEFSSATGQLFNSLTFTVIGQGIEGSGSDGMEFIIESCIGTDTDGDGIPNQLDLDSDADDCPDAIEGDENVTASQLTANRISGTVNANGVPNFVNSGGAADIGGDQGQGAGQAYTVNPAAVGGTASSNQTICWNTTPSAITLTGYTGTIQWQSSADNVTFTNISGATSASYSPGTLTSTTYYRAIVSSVGGCTVTSNTITITVNNCIDAVNDTYSSVTPGTSTTSVIANDKNNSGTAAVIGTGAGQVSIRTSTDAAGTAGAWPTGFTLNAAGTITVAAGTAAGTYTLYYTICNQTAGSPCDTAAVTITVFIPFCYKPAQTSGTILDTNHGITALGRAGADNSNWPMVRKGAWTALEAKTKGFVVNRLTDVQISAIPAAQLVEGMMVYNVTQDCLQINVDGTATGWKCFNTQTCPD